MKTLIATAVKATDTALDPILNTLARSSLVALPLVDRNFNVRAVCCEPVLQAFRRPAALSDHMADR